MISVRDLIRRKQKMRTDKKDEEKKDEDGEKDETEELILPFDLICGS